MTKLYNAMVWTHDPAFAGKRVSVHAENLDEARKMLEAEYGKGNVFALYNEEEAEQVR